MFRLSLDGDRERSQSSLFPIVVCSKNQRRTIGSFDRTDFEDDRMSSAMLQVQHVFLVFHVVVFGIDVYRRGNHGVFEIAHSTR